MEMITLGVDWSSLFLGAAFTILSSLKNDLAFINSLIINKGFVMRIMKLPARRVGFPGNVLSIYNVPLDPAYNAGLTCP